MNSNDVFYSEMIPTTISYVFKSLMYIAVCIFFAIAVHLGWDYYVTPSFDEIHINKMATRIYAEEKAYAIALDRLERELDYVGSETIIK